MKFSKERLKKIIFNLKNFFKSTKEKKDKNRILNIKNFILNIFQSKVYTVFFKGKFYKVENGKKINVENLDKVDYLVVYIPKIYQEFVSLPIPNKKKTKQYIKTFVEAKLKLDLSKYYFDYFKIDENPESKEIIFSFIAIEKDEINKLIKNFKISFSCLVPLSFAVAAYISSFLKEDELGIALLKNEDEVRVLLIKDNFPIEIINDYVSFDYEEYIYRIISYFAGKYPNYKIRLLYFLDISVNENSFKDYQVIIDKDYDFILTLPKSRLKVKFFSAYFSYLNNILFFVISVYILFSFIFNLVTFINYKKSIEKKKEEYVKLKNFYKRNIKIIENKKRIIKSLLAKYTKIVKLKDIDIPNISKFLKTYKKIERTFLELWNLYDRELYLSSIEVEKKDNKLFLVVKGKIISDTKGKMKAIAIELKRNFEYIRFDPKIPKPPFTNFVIKIPLEE